MLQEIIASELEKRLKRKPSNGECLNAYNDIVDNFEYGDNLTDISNILSDYIANNYTQCEQCGEYHLNNEIQTISGPEGWQKVCSNKDCELRAHTDVNYNRCREWATY